MKHNSFLYMLLALSWAVPFGIYAADTEQPAEQSSFEIKNTKNFLPQFITQWFAKKKKIPLSPHTDYQIKGLIGVYPPKVYWIIDQLKQADAPFLSNRLILYGPPGNGKSTLARAIAEKAGCNILSLNGPAVITSYLGEGAQQIRECFDKAAELYEKSKKKVVVFIDEVDAFCRSINYETPTRAEHQAATQQLWLALDKYKHHPGIFFICATNHFDKLDRTFLDRFNTNTIEIPNPDAIARRNILKHYLAKHNITFDESLLEGIVKNTEGISCRTLEDLICDVAVARIMYGPSQVDSDMVWELLRETKKKFAGSKNPIQDNISKLHNWLSVIAISVALPEAIYRLSFFLSNVRHAGHLFRAPSWSPEITWPQGSGGAIDA